jgi:5'-deoxy-5'-methylthioadenosine phosphorylase
MLAVIGGSGVAGLNVMKIIRREIVRTPYGEPSAPLVFGEIAGAAMLFLVRHGPGHIHPPHCVNYRANMQALQHSGATAVVAIAAVGGIGDTAAPGSIVVPSQIIDYTYGREHTYFDGADRRVQHVDFTEPYDAALRENLLKAAKAAGVAAVDDGVYAATQGPRLETGAEINRIARDGGTVVGMTGMPEAALARELGLPYAHLCVVSNWAAGRGDSRRVISHAVIEKTLEHSVNSVQQIILQFAKQSSQSTGK